MIHQILSPTFSMAAMTLGPLFSKTHVSFRSLIKPILVGAILFGTLMMLVQFAFQKNVQQGSNALMEGLGVDPARLEELNRRIEAGDETALQEMMAGIGNATEGMTEDEQAAFVAEKFLGSFSSMLPALGIGMLISILIGVIASTYFAILALRGVSDPMQILRQTPGLIFPMIGLSIWVMLRTFIWIPFIGIIPAIILAPRFLVSSVYLVRDGKGITESARLSYAATGGYWGKILGNSIALGVVFFVVMVVVSVIVGIIGSIASPVGGWIMQVVQQGVSAFAILFFINLALTIMENPRMVAAK